MSACPACASDVAAASRFCASCGSVSSGTTPWLAVPLSMILMRVFVTALVREGLLSLITTIFAVGLIANPPLSLELAQWYSMPTRVVLAIVAALAVYALSTALRQAAAAARSDSSMAGGGLA